MAEKKHYIFELIILFLLGGAGLSLAIPWKNLTEATWGASVCFNADGSRDVFGNANASFTLRSLKLDPAGKPLYIFSVDGTEMTYRQSSSRRTENNTIHFSNEYGENPYTDRAAIKMSDGDKFSSARIQGEREYIKFELETYDRAFVSSEWSGTIARITSHGLLTLRSTEDDCPKTTNALQ